MNKSDNIADLAAALAKAQATIKGAAKDSDNPFFKSKYADLASVWDAAREPLTANGLSVIQTPSSMLDETGKMHLFISSMLLHSSGQFVWETCEVPMVKIDPQGWASAVTYGRRVSLAALSGISPIDLDAEDIMNRDEKSVKPPSAARAAMNATTPPTRVHKIEPTPTSKAESAPEQDTLPKDIVQATIKRIAEETGDRYEGFKNNALLWIAKECGVKTKADYDALTMTKAQEIVTGLHLQFGSKQEREPGQEG